MLALAKFIDKATLAKLQRFNADYKATYDNLTMF